MKVLLKSSVAMQVALAGVSLFGLAGGAFAQLRVGAARVEITPPLEAGMDAPTGKYDHEHLYVRAIVVDNGKDRAVLIGADQGSMPTPVWETASKKIAAEVNCPVANILMSATHTHSSGVAFGGGGAAGGGLSPANQRLADGMVRAVEEAKGKLQPAEMAFGTGQAYLNVNRDTVNPETHKWTQGPNLNAPSDKTVAVLAFERPQGHTPIAVYVNYAMHPINGYLANFTSGDFAEAMSRYVEKDFNDEAVAIFSQGASGDQNPLYLHASTDGMASRSGVSITGEDLEREHVEEPLRDNKVPGKPMEAAVRDRLENWMQVEGEVLGEEAIRVITHTQPVQGNVRIWAKQTEVTCPGRKRTDQGREGMQGQYEDSTPVPLRLGVIGIGDVALTHIDAEVYTMIGQKVKRESPMNHTVFVALANGAAPSGYIPDEASYGHNTFQVLGARIKQGCAEDTISNTLAQIISENDTEQP